MSYHIHQNLRKMESRSFSFQFSVFSFRAGDDAVLIFRSSFRTLIRIDNKIVLQDVHVSEKDWYTAKLYRRIYSIEQAYWKELKLGYVYKRTGLHKG